jgi:hypothetical protein
MFLAKVLPHLRDETFNLPCPKHHFLGPGVRDEPGWQDRRQGVVPARGTSAQRLLDQGGVGTASSLDSFALSRILILAPLLPLFNLGWNETDFRRCG